MRGKILPGEFVTAWLVPAVPITREISKLALHALDKGCVCRQGFLSAPPQPLFIGRNPSTLTVQLGEASCLVYSHRHHLHRRHHRRAPPLLAGREIEEEGFSYEDRVSKHDDRFSCRVDVEEVHADGVKVTASNEQRQSGGGEETEQRGQEGVLMADKIQQQALIKRLATLEARRDWRGVLAAMVREENGFKVLLFESAPHLPVT